MAWEYQIVEIRSSGKYLIKELNDLGRQGWQICAWADSDGFIEGISRTIDAAQAPVVHTTYRSLILKRWVPWWRLCINALLRVFRKREASQ